ncbi:MAG TPA: four helix bundle protein [Gemmatimonadaceae bacterium]
MDTPAYRNLKVWQKAMDLVLEAYALARRLPANERYGLTSQLQRAAVSVPANIAEGNGRVHPGEYLHHLSIARGSLLELDTHLEVARRLDYFSEHDLAEIHRLRGHVSRMLHGLMARLRT